jgi:hypothetical protein
MHALYVLLLGIYLMCKIPNSNSKYSRPTVENDMSSRACLKEITQKNKEKEKKQVKTGLK